MLTLKIVTPYLGYQHMYLIFISVSLFCLSSGHQDENFVDYTISWCEVLLPTHSYSDRFEEVMMGTSRSNSCDDTAKELVITGLRIRTNNERKIITQKIEMKAGGNKTSIAIYVTILLAHFFLTLIYKQYGAHFKYRQRGIGLGRYSWSRLW